MRHFKAHIKNKCKGDKIEKPVHETTTAMQQYLLNGKGIQGEQDHFSLGYTKQEASDNINTIMCLNGRR